MSNRLWWVGRQKCIRQTTFFCLFFSSPPRANEASSCSSPSVISLSPKDKGNAAIRKRQKQSKVKPYRVAGFGLAPPAIIHIVHPRMNAQRRNKAKKIFYRRRYFILVAGAIKQEVSGLCAHTKFCVEASQSVVESSLTQKKGRP